MIMIHYGRFLATAIGAAVFAAGPALAVTVTNQSDKAHEVTVDLGAEEPKTNIEAGKSAKVDCPEGCEIRVVAGSSYGIAAKPDDKIVIGKDGMLMHEGQKAADAGKAAGEKGKAKN
jgi:hypothetical protein